MPSKNNNKTKPRRSPRRNLKRGPTGNVRPNNSLQSVQKNLSKVTISRRLPATTNGRGPIFKYLTCRASPFVGGAPDGIPDALSSAKLVVDHRDYANITVGTSGAFQIRLLPSLPTPVCLKPVVSGGSSGFYINGNPITTSPGTTPTYNTDLCPLVIIKEWQNYCTSVANGYQEVLPPYAAMKYRIVSVACKITYTGQATTAQGTITATMSRAQYKTDEATRGQTFTYLNVGSGTSVTASNYDTVPVNTTTANGLFTDTSVTVRADKMLEINLPRNGGDYTWKEMRQVPVYAVDGDENAQRSLFTSTSLGTPMPPPTMMFDDDLSACIVDFNGIANNATFRVETALCVEYQPFPDSQFAKLTRKHTGGVPASTLQSMDAKLATQLPNIRDSPTTASSAMTAAQNALNQQRAMAVDAAKSIMTSAPPGRRR